MVADKARAPRPKVTVTRERSPRRCPWPTSDSPSGFDLTSTDVGSPRGVDDRARPSLRPSACSPYPGRSGYDGDWPDPTRSSSAVGGYGHRRGGRLRIVVSPDAVEELFATRTFPGLVASSQRRRNSVRVQWTSLATTLPTRPFVRPDLDLAERPGRWARRPRGRARRSRALIRAAQLLGHERLGDVVIGAGLETGHHIVRVGPGRDHDNGSAAVSSQIARQHLGRPCRAA